MLILYFALKLQYFFNRIDCIRNVDTESVTLTVPYVGLVLCVSVDNIEALDNLWEDYKTRPVSDIIKSLMTSPDLLNAAGAKSIELSVLLSARDVEQCRSELLNHLVPKYNLENNRKYGE